ncbi:MAG: OST-HTH/LOTUS domain-containing protein [Sedimenticola sp.]|nr:OST-HTH/LOTUS domain-containing protein [Sedimenticola sp.]
MANEISRKIGRCILRLQQYEISLKAMLSSKDLYVYGDTGESNHEERQNEVATKTLGQLVSELTGTYLLGEEESREDQDNHDDQLDLTRPSFRMRCSMDIEDKEYQRVEAGLKQLVKVRNELVHHFLDRFNLNDESCLTNANVYLDEAYQVIDERLLELHSWAKSMDDTRLRAKTFIESHDCKHFMSYGFLPGQLVDWPNTPIIRFLFQAEDSYRLDGWTNLEDAITYVRKQRPELGPKKYGCSSWRHVLHESGMFDIEKRPCTKERKKQVWYRRRLGLA